MSRDDFDVIDALMETLADRIQGGEPDVALNSAQGALLKLMRTQEVYLQLTHFQYQTHSWMEFRCVIHRHLNQTIQGHTNS